MPYMKFFSVPSPSGGDIVVRLITGSDQEHATYSGTLVLPAELFEHMLDSLVLGASHMNFGDGENLEVRFGPDPGADT